MAGRNPVPGGEKSRRSRSAFEFESLNPVEGTPAPPGHLDEDAQFAWAQACRSLIPARLVSHIDLLALEAFAQTFSRWRRCERACRRGGGEYMRHGKGPGAARQISPERSNANKALEQFMRIGRDLGMTVVSRLKVTDSPQGDLPLGEPDADPDDIATADALDQDNNDTVIRSIFRPRPVAGRGGPGGG